MTLSFRNVAIMIISALLISISTCTIFFVSEIIVGYFGIYDKSYAETLTLILDVIMCILFIFMLFSHYRKIIDKIQDISYAEELKDALFVLNMIGLVEIIILHFTYILFMRYALGHRPLAGVSHFFLGILVWDVINRFLIIKLLDPYDFRRQ